MTSTEVLATPVNVPEALDIFAAYANDEVAEESGTQVTLDLTGDVLWTIARLGNTAYAKMFRSLFKKHEKQYKNAPEDSKEALDAAVQMEIILLSNTVLKGWDKPVKYKGETMAYSVENAKKLLEMRDFRMAIKRAADDAANFKAVKDQEIEKN